MGSNPVESPDFSQVHETIAHLHDDVMRALHCGSCSQQKTTIWRLIVVVGSLVVFQGVLATVKET